MKTAHKIVILTIALSLGLSLLGCAVVFWLEGDYGRSPSAIGLGATGWLLVSVLVERFVPTTDAPE